MQTVIHVEQLSKSYGKLPVIDKISLSVKRGTVYGLLGENGAGKSTKIECILGTKNADSGTVSVLGCNPKKVRHRLFQKVGVQFQEGDYQPEIKVSERNRTAVLKLQSKPPVSPFPLCSLLLLLPISCASF